MPLRRITSFVSQLVVALALLAFFAMSHFNQGPVFKGSFDLVIAGVQERSCNLPEATHATCSAVGAARLHKPHQGDCQHTSADDKPK
jgi:hypothetical protein